jgi:hypothetical protein
VAALLARWQADGVLRRDTSTCLYVYEEIYQLRGTRRVQRGVLASVALDDTGTWVVPHERTMAAPVADRLRLLEATEVNLSPVFGVYAGAGGPAAVLDGVTATEPALDCADETGVRHRLWVVADPDRIAAWRERMAPQRVLIADGHHRYRTSLAYRDASAGRQRRPARGPGTSSSCSWSTPTCTARRSWPSTGCWPTGRRDGAGRPRGRLRRPAAASPAEAERRLGGLLEEAVAFGLYSGGRSWLLVARDPAGLAAEAGRDRRMLDVEVLHGPVLSKRLGVSDFEGRVGYESDLAAAVAAVDQGAAASLLILRPARFGAGGRDRRRRRDPAPEDDVLLPQASRRVGAEAT